MKRPVIALLLFFLFIGTSRGKDIDPVFYKLKSTYQKFHNITASFEQISVIPDYGERKFYGRLYIKRPYKARWDYIKPLRERIYLTKDRLIMYMPEEKRVIIQRHIQNSGVHVAIRLLMDIDEWKNLFRVKNLKKTSDKFTMELVPLQEGGVTQVGVMINRKNFLIEKIVLEQEDGSRISFMFYKINIREKLSDRIFDFEPTEDMEVLEY